MAKGNMKDSTGVAKKTQLKAPNQSIQKVSAPSGAPPQPTGKGPGKKAGIKNSTSLTNQPQIKKTPAPNGKPF